jgi:hypothetical protein
MGKTSSNVPRRRKGRRRNFVAVVAFIGLGAFASALFFQISALDALQAEAQQQQQQQPLFGLIAKTKDDCFRPYENHQSNAQINTTSCHPPSAEKHHELEKDDLVFIERITRRFREAVEYKYEYENELANVTNTKSRSNISTKKPIAIVHVGPRKTGSTSVQRAITRYSVELAQANYTHTIATRVHLFSHCLTLKTTSSHWQERCKHNRLLVESIRNTINMARLEHKNIIISSESLDQVSKIDPRKINQILHGFDVHIVVIYRRFDDWIVSEFGQTYRHGLHNNLDQWDTTTTGTSSTATSSPGRLAPSDSNNVVAYLTPATMKKLYNRFYSAEVYRMYKTAGLFQTTQLLNFHDTGNNNEDIVRPFFCLSEMKAPAACQRANREPAPKLNAAESMVYDQIAVAAYQAGLLNGSKVTRPRARKAVQDYMETNMGITEEQDLPRTCVQGRNLELLERITTLTEALAFPEFHTKNEASRMQEELEERKTTKLCSVDTGKIMEGASMRSFLSLLAG